MDGGFDQDGMEKETVRYELRYAFNSRTDQHELRLRSRGGGKNFSIHTHFNLLSEKGEIIDNPPITPDVATFIFENFETRGDTASFEIYREDLASGKLGDSRDGNLRPEDVRHNLTTTEHSYTATGAKLTFHAPIFDKYRETGYGSIIRATMTLHQVCSSKCQYCSTILRNRADAITLDEAKQFVTALYDYQAAFNRDKFAKYNDDYKKRTGTDIRLRGLILSGGGQPNLWPHFSEFVRWLAERDIDLGLITNGFPKDIPEDIYNNFKWIRISITPGDASPHYPGGRFDDQYIPGTIKHNDEITVGYSYVFGPWTDDEILQRIDRSVEADGFRYCRMLTDCNLTRQGQLAAHHELAEKLHRIGLIDGQGEPLGRLFHQLTYHGERQEAAELWDEGQCYLQIYNAFWDTTGHEENGFSHCYPCDSVTVLAEEAGDRQISVSERRFNPDKWGTVKNTEIEKLFTEPVHPWFDPRDICTSCLFMRNNRTVKQLSRDGDQNFHVPGKIEHVNFP